MYERDSKKRQARSRTFVITFTHRTKGLSIKFEVQQKHAVGRGSAEPLIRALCGNKSKRLKM